MALHVSKEDVPAAGFDARGGELETRMVYGKSTSMVYARRPDGYHSSPHVHPAEQLNFVLEGELWMFVEDEAVLLEPGDFHRVPGMAVHWAKVEDGPCVLVEAHSPPYVGDDELAGEDKEHVVGLFADDEEPVADEESGSVWAAESYAENEEAMMESFLSGEE